MAMKMSLLFVVLLGTVSVWTRMAAIAMQSVCRRKDAKRVSRRVGPIAVYTRPVTMEPAIIDSIEMPERAHLRSSLPTGRLAVLRARKMVLPELCHYYCDAL